MSNLPNVSGLDRLYANRFSEREKAEKLVIWRTLCDAFFSRYVAADAAVLDVGAGYCDFINNIRAGRKVAVDLNPDTKTAAGPGVEVHLLPLERLVEATGRGTMDVAFASNVFEHLRGPEVLLEVLASIREALKPGGRIVIMQPNARRVGMRFWDFVDHTLPLTEKGMEEALTMSGFRMVENRASFLPYTTKSRLPKSALLLRIYLWFRPIQWLMGKQMFLVAQKPR